MTLEEIETIFDKEIYSSGYYRISGKEKFSKLILASHLRSQIELLDKLIEKLESEMKHSVLLTMPMEVPMKYCIETLKEQRNKLESELTKLNQ